MHRRWFKRYVIYTWLTLAYGMVEVTLYYTSYQNLYAPVSQYGEYVLITWLFVSVTGVLVMLARESPWD